MSFRNTTKESMMRRNNRTQMLERLSANLSGETISTAAEVKELKDSGKSCSLCSKFLPQWVKCKLGRKIITKFNICSKFEGKEEDNKEK